MALLGGGGTSGKCAYGEILRSAMQKLGEKVFEEVYDYLKRARHQNASETEIRECLEKVVPRASDCYEVDQLLYFEEQLLIAVGKEPPLQNPH
ncbi:Serine/threonine-protein kinase Nek11 [Heterocephalus glaber]|uniref:Serine/threonine-protein kinase Nek11 n=1 Tax=Heterocephalus glaber TaxID=10181 RepID=G5AM70_HETGA|nr:Serine/threonine-protein kinase Nek11 [Heterocephalus glaber]